MASKSIGSLAVYLTGNTIGLDRALHQATAGIHRFARNAVRNASIAAGAMAAVVAKGLRDYAVEEDATAALRQALKSTGYAAGLSSQQLEDMAAQIQKVTRYGDEVVKQAQAQLLTFKQIGAPLFKPALMAALDLSTLLKTDLKSSIMMVGKALDNPVKGMTALTRAGVGFTDEAADGIRKLVAEGRTYEAQLAVLAGLEGQVKGQAEAAAKTAGGFYDQMRASLSDLSEGVGRTAAAFGRLGAEGKTALDAIREASERVNDRALENAFVYRTLTVELTAALKSSGAVFAAYVNNVYMVGKAAFDALKGVILATIKPFTDLEWVKAFGRKMLQIVKQLYVETGRLAGAAGKALLANAKSLATGKGFVGIQFELTDESKAILGEVDGLATGIRAKLQNIFVEEGGWVDRFTRPWRDIVDKLEDIADRKDAGLDALAAALGAIGDEEVERLKTEAQAIKQAAGGAGDGFAAERKRVAAAWAAREKASGASAASGLESERKRLHDEWTALEARAGEMERARLVSERKRLADEWSALKQQAGANAVTQLASERKRLADERAALDRRSGAVEFARLAAERKRADAEWMATGKRAAMMARAGDVSPEAAAAESEAPNKAAWTAHVARQIKDLGNQIQALMEQPGAKLSESIGRELKKLEVDRNRYWAELERLQAEQTAAEGAASDARKARIEEEGKLRQRWRDLAADANDRGRDAKRRDEEGRRDQGRAAATAGNPLVQAIEKGSMAALQADQNSRSAARAEREVQMRILRANEEQARMLRRMARLPSGNQLPFALGLDEIFAGAQ